MGRIECTTVRKNGTIVVRDRRKTVSFACLNSVEWTNMVGRVQYYFTSRVVLESKDFHIGTS
jgi:hypothetical protein